MKFDRSVCTSLESALKREWLETNGLGGFASSTIAGINTRRYHGLLVAATKPPVGRCLLLSKLEDTIVVDGERWNLSANCYPGVVHPQGYRYLKEFRLDPFPVFIYQAAGLEIEKRLFLVHGENTTVVEYKLCGVARRCILEIRPLIAFRDYHSTTHQNDALNPTVEIRPGLASVMPYDSLPRLYFAHDAVELETTGHWYFNFEYGEERDRGLDYQEDLFNPFLVRFELGRHGSAALIASTEIRDISQAPALRNAEIHRRADVVAAAPCDHAVVRALVAAADQLIVDRGELKTVIAGYHWFGDWGRDTMIALPGLTLSAGRPEAAQSILLAFANSVNRGMLPNRFPEAGEAPEYNSVDAALWFFEAIRALVKYTGNAAFVRDNLYQKMKEIVEWHLRGTRYGIRVDSDGLLACGEPGVQLTWMDSKVGDRVVTPRYGKPVEIQALWYNALCTMEELSRTFGEGEKETFFGELAAHAQRSFNRLFWNEQTGCLYDVVDGDSRDSSIRPNQVFAVSLAHAILSEDRWRPVLDVVRRELFVPLGLRSLSPGDPRYCPRYTGGIAERDSAYHQGTVWTWLIGPFITAYVKVNGRSPEARVQAKQWLEGFGTHLSTAGLGQISEIVDADAPHQPRGCIAQAWSVAELLRAAAEDIFEVRGYSGLEFGLQFDNKGR